VTAILKDKIEAVWGGSFNVNGLGGVLTCGVTGFGAGLSHAPVCKVCVLFIGGRDRRGGSTAQGGLPRDCWCWCWWWQCVLVACLVCGKGQWVWRSH